MARFLGLRTPKKASTNGVEVTSRVGRISLGCSVVKSIFPVRQEFSGSESLNEKHEHCQILEGVKSGAGLKAFGRNLGGDYRRRTVLNSGSDEGFK